MKLNSSFKLNREFSNQVERMSEECGIEMHIARNIIRFRRGIKRIHHVNKKVWLDPSTGKTLSQAQWTGPYLTLQEKIKNGTESTSESAYKDEDFKNNNDPDMTWFNAIVRGMTIRGGVMLTVEESNRLDSDARVESSLISKLASNGLEN